jgi:hypothetical protein
MFNYTNINDIEMDVGFIFKAKVINLFEKSIRLRINNKDYLIRKNSFMNRFNFKENTTKNFVIIQWNNMKKTIIPLEFKSC